MASRDGDQAFEAEQELAFADANDRLPWLESDDDEPPVRELDTGRLVAFAVVGLMAIALVAGLVWWFTRDHTVAPQASEGTVIAAPPGPYKVKPSSAGGRQVAGTGDTSFEVAEGHEVEAHLADSKASVAPAASATASATPSAPATPMASGIGVQVGAYLSRAQAEAGWTQLQGRLDPLHGRSHRVVEGVADAGTVFRLQAVAGSVAEADALCRSIKTAGGDCQVKR